MKNSSFIIKTSGLLLLCAAFAGCSSMTGAKSGANAPVASVSANPETNRDHARIITEYSEGESKFLEMAPEGDAGNQ
jgi:hypothetical protein